MCLSCTGGIWLLVSPTLTISQMFLCNLNGRELNRMLFGKEKFRVCQFQLDENDSDEYVLSSSHLFPYCI